MRAGRVAVAVLITLSFVSLAACGGGKSSKEQAAPKKVKEKPRRPIRYQLRLHAAVTSRRIKVTGSTNLPDGARVEVAAARMFRYAKERDVRASPIGSGRPPTASQATVAGRSFTVDVPLDEHTLPVGVPDPYAGPIHEVDPSVTVCAVFRTGRDAVSRKWEQPDPRVRAEVGPSGEHLKGSPRVSVFGSLTKNPSLMLEALTRVRHPVTVMDQIVAVQKTRPRVVKLKAFCTA